MWSITLHARETRTLRKPDIRRIESFQMWCWRRKLDIEWKDYRMKGDIVNAIDEERRPVGSGGAGRAQALE